MDNFKHQNSVLKFRLSKPPESQGGDLDKRTAFVRNIPDDIPELKLKEIFEQYGPIEEIRIIMQTRAYTKNKGIAYI
jgi:RNA recognition motif-containing protein